MLFILVKLLNKLDAFAAVAAKYSYDMHDHFNSFLTACDCQYFAREKLGVVQ